MVQEIHQRIKESSKNCERSWRKSKHQHQWQAYMKERNVYNRLLVYHKKQTISKKIKKIKNDKATTPPYQQYYHEQNTQPHARRNNGCKTCRRVCFILSWKDWKNQTTIPKHWRIYPKHQHLSPDVPHLLLMTNKKNKKADTQHEK